MSISLIGEVVLISVSFLAQNLPRLLKCMWSWSNTVLFHDHWLVTQNGILLVISFHVLWSRVERATTPLSTSLSLIQRWQPSSAGSQIYSTAPPPPSWLPRRRLHATDQTVGHHRLPFIFNRFIVFFPSSSVGAILHTMAYGGETKPFDDPFINTADEVSECISDAALTSTMLVEVVPKFMRPLLKYLSSAQVFARTPLQWKELQARFLEDPFWNTQKSVVCFPLSLSLSLLTFSTYDLAYRLKAL